MESHLKMWKEGIEGGDRVSSDGRIRDEMNENIYELLYMYRMKDEDATRILFEIMKSVREYELSQILAVYTVVKNYEDEFRLEADVCFTSAVDLYSEERECSFQSYLHLIVRRRYWHMVKRLKHSYVPGFNQTVELDREIIDGESLLNLIRNQTPLNDPVYSMQYMHAAEELLRFSTTLKEKERIICQCLLNGDSYETAARTLGITYKQYDGRLRRLRKKIRDAISMEK